LDSRKLAFMALTAALLVNATISFWQGGLPGPAGIDGPDSSDTVSVNDRVDIPLPKEGSIYSFDHSSNLTLVRENPEEGSDVGTYHLDAVVKREWGSGSMLKVVSGTHELSYTPSRGSKRLMVGSVDQGVDVRLDQEGNFVRQYLSTAAVYEGSLLGPRSSVDVVSERYLPRVDEDLWMRLLDGRSSFEAGSFDGMEMELDLPSLGVEVGMVSIRWETTSVFTRGGREHAAVEFTFTHGNGFQLSHGIILREGTSVPVRSDLLLNGTYSSEGGTIRMEMRVIEVLEGEVVSDGAELRLMPGPRPPTPDVLPTRSVVGLVQPGGAGETMYTHLPEEALEKALGESFGLADFILTHGEDNVTTSACTYYRNQSNLNTHDQIWNITFTTNDDRSRGDSYYVQVGAPSREGQFDLLGLRLISEGSYRSHFAPDPNRRCMTLEAHERLLLSDEWMRGRFTDGDAYMPDYELDIRSRGGEGLEPFHALAFHLLGMRRAVAEDVFISCAPDSEDPKTVYVGAVDGQEGTILFRTVVVGNYIQLLSGQEFA